MRTFQYSGGASVARDASLGLIVLQSDETIEHDFRRLLPPEGVGLYHSRVQSAPDVTTETLAQMEQSIPDAAHLLPRPVAFDVVGYGCTSGTSVIGAETVSELVRAGCTTRAVTEPLTALIAACRTLGIRRLAFLSPYMADVSAALRGALSKAGIECPVFGSFEEVMETLVARIEQEAVLEAAVDLASDQQAEAVFLSCTNLRTLDVLAEIEARSGKPALSSNQVLAWHMMQLAGMAPEHEHFGRLFKAPEMAE